MFALWAASPVDRGHALIVTRRHVATYFEASPEDKAAIWDALEAVKTLLDEQYTPQGYTVTFDADFKQTPHSPRHLRVHVIPRFERSAGAYDARRMAECLGISEELTRTCLTQLQRAGIVEQNRARFRAVSTLSVDTKALGQLKAHWSDVASKRALAPQHGDVFCYNVLAASEQDVQEIGHLLRATYQQIRSIVANTPSEEAAAVVNLQLVNWRDPNDEHEG